MVAILNSIVLNGYYAMLRYQTRTLCFPCRNQNGCRMEEKVYPAVVFTTTMDIKLKMAASKININLSIYCTVHVRF